MESSEFFLSDIRILLIALFMTGELDISEESVPRLFPM